MKHSARPSQQSVQALLDIILPDANDFTVHDLAGSYSNFTHRVKAISDGGGEQSIVIRRYNPDNCSENWDYFSSSPKLLL